MIIFQLRMLFFILFDFALENLVPYHMNLNLLKVLLTLIILHLFFFRLLQTIFIISIFFGLYCYYWLSYMIQHLHLFYFWNGLLADAGIGLFVHLYRWHVWDTSFPLWKCSVWSVCVKAAYAIVEHWRLLIIVGDFRWVFLFLLGSNRAYFETLGCV